MQAVGVARPYQGHGRGGLFPACHAILCFNLAPKAQDHGRPKSSSRKRERYAKIQGKLSLYAAGEQEQQLQHSSSAAAGTSQQQQQRLGNGIVISTMHDMP